MTLTKSRWRIDGRSGYVQADLASLGVPRNRLYAKPGRYVRALPRHGVSDSFWSRPHFELVDILKDAKKIYLLKMKKHHPDSGNGSPDTASTLTVIWARIRRLFKQRGIEL